MAHLREQIRDRVVTDLTGLTTTGSRVFRSRIYPLESNDLPGLCIFTKSETTDYDTITLPRSTSRILEIGVDPSFEKYCAISKNAAIYPCGVTTQPLSMDCPPLALAHALVGDQVRDCHPSRAVG